MSLTPGIAVDIVCAESAGRYRLDLTFSDGHTVSIDFGPFIRNSMNPETRRFLDEKAFMQFSLRQGNLVWGDYEMCFPVADLYEGSIGYVKQSGQVLAVAEERAAYGTGKKARMNRRCPTGGRHDA